MDGCLKFEPLGFLIKQKKIGIMSSVHDMRLVIMVEYIVEN